MTTHWAGVLAALVTGVSWGVVSPLGRILALRGVDMTTVVLGRTILTALVLLLWLLLKNPRSLRISFHEGLVLLAYSLLVIPLTATGFMYSLKYLTVPAALIIHYTFPLATLLGGLWITKERPTIFQYIAAFLVIAGVWIGVFASGASNASFSLLGVFWGTVAVIGLSGQFLMGRALLSRDRFSSSSMIFYGHLFGGVDHGDGQALYFRMGRYRGVGNLRLGVRRDHGARRQRAEALRLLLLTAFYLRRDGQHTSVPRRYLRA